MNSKKNPMTSPYSYWCHPLLLLILFSINTVTDVIPCYSWYISVSIQLLMSSLVTADIVQYQDSYWCITMLQLIYFSIKSVKWYRLDKRMSEEPVSLCHAVIISFIIPYANLYGNIIISLDRCHLLQCLLWQSEAVNQRTDICYRVFWGNQKP
jgi:hypothetical protein